MGWLLQAELDKQKFFAKPKLALDCVGGNSTVRLSDALAAVGLRFSLSNPTSTNKNTCDAYMKPFPCKKEEKKSFTFAGGVPLNPLLG